MTPYSGFGRYFSWSATTIFALLVAAPLAAAPPGMVSPRIIVDQFGYPPEMVKIAILSDPQAGFNAAESYSPGSTIEVRAVGSNAVVF
jgi:hypothetical protein